MGDIDQAQVLGLAGRSPSLRSYLAGGVHPTVCGAEVEGTSVVVFVEERVEVEVRENIFTSQWVGEVHVGEVNLVSLLANARILSRVVNQVHTIAPPLSIPKFWVGSACVCVAGGAAAGPVVGAAVVCGPLGPDTAAGAALPEAPG